MPKEVVAAIIVGGMLGVAIALGVWRANLALFPRKTATQTQMPTPSETSEPTVQFLLTVETPEDGAVILESPLDVSGKTKAGATVVISTSESETVVMAGENGNYTGKVELSAGPNTITVNAFDSDDETTEKQINVVYSTELSQKQ